MNKEEARILRNLISNATNLAGKVRIPTGRLMNAIREAEDMMKAQHFVRKIVFTATIAEGERRSEVSVTASTKWHAWQQVEEIICGSEWMAARIVKIEKA